MRKNKLSDNRLFSLLTICYISIVLIVGLIACFFSYQQKKETILSELDITYIQMKQHYIDIIDNFWQVYMPIYETGNSTHKTITSYFVRNTELTPSDKKQLHYAMSQMIMRNDEIQWIAFLNETREINYILYASKSSILELPSNFPYMDDILNKKYRMEVYGQKTLIQGNALYNTYAISGGAPYGYSGHIIVGYSTNYFTNISKDINNELNSLIYTLTSADQTIFTSDPIDANQINTMTLQENSLIETVSNNDDVSTEDNITLHNKNSSYYKRSEYCGDRYSVLTYQILSKELFLYSHQNTPLILLIIICFAAFSVFLYGIIIRSLSKEVSIIRDGLKIIGTNQLDYQFSNNFKQNSLKEISTEINKMTSTLKENIDRAYYYQIRQKDAELSELQAKFSPHFLYNSLEMLRSRCIQNNDHRTAELITQLAAIFRGFIGSKTFISLKEELSFSKRYISLFGARYGEQVQVCYDFEPEILKYGIIRNLLQPIIENYFVHGYEPSIGDENYIMFRGISINDTTYAIIIEDNGIGINSERLNMLLQRLDEPIESSTESYGLKNIHQRLRLFYGEDCGLSIYMNEDKGISIRITCRKLTVEEYEQSKNRI